MPVKKETPEAEVTPERRILVFQGKKSFIITTPPDAKTTFGPWVPPAMRAKDRYGGIAGMPGDAVGTLRVYGRTEKHVLGVFSGVTGFRDLSLGYVEVTPELLEEVEEEELIEVPFDRGGAAMKMPKRTKEAVYDYKKASTTMVSDTGPLPFPPVFEYTPTESISLSPGDTIKFSMEGLIVDDGGKLVKRHVDSDRK